ncbi:BTB domain-containing protein [Mycena indigotica]|uniref:BTB domain-containing protein n=1 Tax=Mycena indigotica TaxID=2126181 RepID=A0A8H6W421_9AGAR|nr:BTB domain-containing protein [Mycena indigotica]KAF7298524.1 BTB domain-containing protein [Mycena indigotica]
MGNLATPILNSSVMSSKLKNFARSRLWFCDGNIILVAASVAFKVHRGQLQRHSEVFDGLFNIPQPPEQDLLEGCPWFEIYDSPTDVFHFLTALYDGLYFSIPHAHDFPIIASVLRCSTKYLVEHLRQRCMARLEVEWPTTLAGWDSREQAATDALGHYAPRTSCAHPILLIDLAVELNLPFLLPAAMYDLARYGPSKIYSGTTVPALTSSIPTTLDADSPLSTMNLPEAFLVATFRGREAAQHYLANFVSTELEGRSPAAECLYLTEDPPSRRCRESFYFITLNVLRSVGGIACGRDADPLFTLVQAMDMLSRTDFSDGQKQCGLKMCHVCKLDFAKTAQTAREEVWQLLPSWFGLEEKKEMTVDAKN